MAMTSERFEQSLCPEPLLDARSVGEEGGYISARVCFSAVGSTEDLSCCLPCPVTEWVYTDSFRQQYRAAESLCFVGFLLCIFLLLSWLLLPKKESKRDYLNVCLVISITALALGFVLPVVTRPKECFDAITPHDMKTSLACAWSGTFIVFGGLAAGTWAFLRSLSLHLLVCWDVHVGHCFFIVAQAIGWSAIIILSGITLGVTGVSFRFGDACHVNVNGSIPSFWGPLIIVSGSSALLQIITFAFGLNLYILKRAWWTEGHYHTSTSARLKQVWNLVRLQWRAITVITLILIDVLFFCFVFLRIDSNEKQIRTHAERARAWIICLTSHLGDKDACVAHAQDLLIDQNTAAALLFLLSVSGIQCFFVFIQKSIIYAWANLVRRGLRCEKPITHADSDDALHVTEVSSATYGVVTRAMTVEVQRDGRRSMVVNAGSGKVDQAVVRSGS